MKNSHDCFNPIITLLCTVSIFVIKKYPSVKKSIKKSVRKFIRKITKRIRRTFKKNVIAFNKNNFSNNLFDRMAI